MNIASMEFPAHVNFDITYRCNAACSFCYVIDRNNEKSVNIDIEKAKDIIERLASQGVFRMNFFGGEPLLVKQLPELIRFAADCGIRSTLITNGLPLTTRFVDEVAGVLEAVAVSIHGLDSRHDQILGVPGAFARLMKVLPILQGSGINLGFNYTVLRGSNEEFLPTAEFLLKTFPANFIAANRFVGGRGKADSELLPSLSDLNGVLCGFEAIEQRYPNVQLSYAIYFPFCLVEDRRHLKYMKGCGMGSNYASVDFNGNMRLCSYSNSVLGNVLQQAAGDIWRNNSTLKEYRGGGWIPKACRDCSEFNACKSGCRVSDPSVEFGPDVLTKLHPIHPYELT